MTACARQSEASTENGGLIWIADALRGDGNRFVVRADEMLTAFLELESAICACGEVAAAVLQRNATAAIVNVARVIASCSYSFCRCRVEHEKLLTLSSRERHDTGCAKSASSDKPPP
jgi:hypothetical protein